MVLRDAFRAFARGPGHALYGAGAPVLRQLCATPLGRAAVEQVMRTGGRTLLWSFDAREQPTPARAKAEWERILRGIGLRPEPSGSHACATCFHRCTLDLKPGDGRTCDAVMSINDEMLTRLGARMKLTERLVDEGGSRCVVEVVEKEARPPEVRAPGERAPWWSGGEAIAHFDTAAGFYDFIMGYFEIPANRAAIRRIPRASRILELGVGTGLALVDLLTRFPHATAVAVDKSRGMLDRARARLEAKGLIDRVELVHGDVTTFDLPPASVDVVYSSFLLDLLDGPARQAVLARARRALAPGGTAHLVVMDGEPSAPHDRALSALYSAGYGRWNPLWQGLFRGYAPHCRPVRLAAQLEASGLTVTARRKSYVTCFPVAIYSARPGDPRGELH